MLDIFVNFFPPVLLWKEKKLLPEQQRFNSYSTNNYKKFMFGEKKKGKETNISFDPSISMFIVYNRGRKAYQKQKMKC